MSHFVKEFIALLIGTKRLSPCPDLRYLSPATYDALEAAKLKAMYMLECERRDGELRNQAAYERRRVVQPDINPYALVIQINGQAAEYQLDPDEKMLLHEIVDQYFSLNDAGRARLDRRVLRIQKTYAGPISDFAQMYFLGHYRPADFMRCMAELSSIGMDGARYQDYKEFCLLYPDLLSLLPEKTAAELEPLCAPLFPCRK